MNHKMKSITRIMMLAVMLLGCTSLAHAWDCTNPLAERVPVAAGTAGSFGDGTGQLFLGTATEGVAGQLYECEVVPPNTDPPAGTINTHIKNTNTNTNQNVNTSGSSSSATGGNSSSTATGGSSTSTNLNNNVANATGGAGGAGGSATATGGSVKNSGNSSSTSTVKDSGNSAIVDSGNSKQSQRQSQKQSQSQSSTSSAVGNGDNSNNETTNVPRQVASAYAATIYPTVPCFKGLSIGGQAPLGGLSFGGGKIDQNCAELEAARQAPNLVARCKILLTNKFYQKAGVTMEDCLGPVVIQTPVAAVAVPTPAPEPVITVNVPAPVVTIIPGPTPPAPVDVVAVAKAPVKHRPAPKCYTEEELERLGLVKAQQ
jgi:hypothetical protein